MSKGGYDKQWVKRPAPKDIHNEDRNSPLSSLLYYLRLMACNSHPSFQVVGGESLLLPVMMKILSII